MITLRDVKASYGEKEVLRVEKLTFPDAVITAIAGENGCGKTTLLRTMCGLTRWSGDITIDEAPLQSLDEASRAKRIAYLPQTLREPHMRVRQLIYHGRFARLSFSKRPGQKDREAVEEALRVTGLESYASETLDQLSGGTRQRAYLAMALAQETKTLLLDEPFASLDVTHTQQMAALLEKLAAQGKSIVLTAHDLPLAFSISSRVCLMQNGTVVAEGTPAELADDPGRMRSLFGAALCRTKEEAALYPYMLSR